VALVRRQVLQVHSDDEVGSRPGLGQHQIHVDESVNYFRSQSHSDWIEGSACVLDCLRIECLMDTESPVEEASNARRTDWRGS